MAALQRWAPARVILLVALVLALAAAGVSGAMAVRLTAGSGPTLEFDRTFLQVGRGVPVGGSATEYLAFYNRGSDPLVISGATTTGPFSVPGLDSCAQPVAPDNGCSIPVTFTPTEEGYRVGSIDVTDNTADGHHSLTLLGTTETGLARLVLDPAAVDFGEVAPGATSPSRTLTLTNQGDGAVYLQDLRADPYGETTTAAEFAVAGTCHDVVLHPGEQCSATVAFTPPDAGPYEATLTAVSGDIGDSNQPWQLEGFGGAPGSRHRALSTPASATLPDATVGLTSLGDVTVTNTGNAPVTTSDLAVTGDFARYKYSSSCDRIAVGASCTIRVQFRPTAPGPRTGTLSFTDTTAAGSHSVALSGNGVDPGPTPRVDALSPNAAQGRANTVVTATGANLDAVTSVTTLGTPAAFTHGPNGTSLTFTVPSTNFVGSDDVRFATATGISTTATFTYLPAPAPVITKVTPTQVYDDGSTLVRVVGTDLDATGVRGLESQRPASFTVSPDRRVVTFREPGRIGAHGTFSFFVETTAGEAKGFLEMVPTPPPTLSATTPNHGPAKGGTAVRLTGANLLATTNLTVDGQSVDWTTNPAGTTLSFRAPAHAAGTVPVVVTTPNGTVATSYTYDPPPGPAITAVSPAHGPAAGGTAVKVTGSGLAGASVTVGGASVAPMVNAAGTSLSFRAPAHAAGTVPVVVTTPNGTATTSYTYDPVPAPMITAVSPTSGPTRGGTAVKVTVGGTAAAATVNAAGTSLTFRTPAHAAGTVPVVVTTASGSATTSYTYR